MIHRIRVAATTLVVATLAVSFLAPSALHAQIQNGSFETPVQTGFTDYFTGTGFTGWNVVGDGAVAIVNGTIPCCGSTLLAQDGTQWLDLTGGNSNSHTGVQQSVATTVGNQYSLSYWVGNTDNPGGTLGITSTVQLYLNLLPVGSSTNANTSVNLTWQQFTQSFVATGTTTTIAFYNGDPSNDNNNGLDDVVLTDQGP